MAVLFIVPFIIEVHEHIFEVFTLVSEIHDNIDLVLRMKNAYKLEGIIEMLDSSFRFLNRSIPFFLGILDLRSLGYYKIKQGVLQQNLSKYYHFESVDKLCEEFNTRVNERKKEEKEIDKD